MSNVSIICLSSSQGHGLWPVSTPWLPSVLYMETVDGSVRGRVGCRRWGGYSSRADMSVSRRPAGDWPLLPRRPVDPCGDSPASSCCRVPLKSPQACLSDWPYGHQCHPATPTVPGMGCGRHEWEAWQLPPAPIFQLSCFQCPHRISKHNYKIQILSFS